MRELPELRDLQADFVRALREPGTATAATAWLAGDASLVARRLAIYRANMTAAADKALSAAYPVIRQLVGEDFFASLARAYQQAHPSASGDLGEFGDRLPAFVADFEHTRPLPYLGDLARLEWAAHQAYGAADAAPWDVSALAAIDPADHARLCLQWAPGLAVIASPWPIVRLWTLHQPGHGGEFTVDWDVAERALVAREGWAVTVSALGAGDAAFLDHMLAGAALGAAADAALQVQPSFDLGALLGRLVAAGQVCGFTLATPT